MITFRQKQPVETFYVFPFTGISKEQTMGYPLEPEVVRNIQELDMQFGNYRIGILDESGNFWVRYAGRTDNGGLVGRLVTHYNEKDFQNNQYYFDYKSAVDDKTAYIQECMDYHRFLDEDGFFLNRIHPDRPKGTSYQCPGCGCPNY